MLPIFNAFGKEILLVYIDVPLNPRPFEILLPMSVPIRLFVNFCSLWPVFLGVNFLRVVPACPIFPRIAYNVSEKRDEELKFPC